MLALVVAAGCAPNPPVSPAAPPDPLVGAWRTRVQFTDGDFAAVKDLEFLIAFNLGGTMNES